MKITQLSSNSISSVLPIDLSPGHKKLTIVQGNYTYSDLGFEVAAFPEVIVVSPNVLVNNKIEIQLTNSLKEPYVITAFMNGKEITIERKPNSINEFLISPTESGTVELKINNVIVKGKSIVIHAYEEILTSEKWAIASVDIDAVSGRIYNYTGKVGGFTFKKDGNYSHIENDIKVDASWKFQWDKNTNKPLIQLGTSEYTSIEKITLDTLIFSSGNKKYKLVPASKVPVVQEIPNSSVSAILTRAKSWSIIPGHEMYGDEIKFLSDGTFILHNLFSNLYEEKGTWVLEKNAGKDLLTISSTNLSGPYQFKIEVIQADFQKLILKFQDFDGNGHYLPRYY